MLDSELLQFLQNAGFACLDHVLLPTGIAIEILKEDFRVALVIADETSHCLSFDLPVVFIPRKTLKKQSDYTRMVEYIEKRIFLMPQPPGEVADRLSIVQIKKNKLTDLTELNKLDLEEFNLRIIKNQLCFWRGPGSKQFIDNEISKLVEINTRQWDFEDLVRKEPETGYAAKEARNCNTERSKVKDSVNFFFGYPTDPKHYCDK